MAFRNSNDGGLPAVNLDCRANDFRAGAKHVVPCFRANDCNCRPVRLEIVLGKETAKVWSRAGVSKEFPIHPRTRNISGQSARHDPNLFGTIVAAACNQRESERDRNDADGGAHTLSVSTVGICHMSRKVVQSVAGE